MRRLQRGDPPLVHRVVRDAAQANLAVAPGLRARPLDAVVEVTRLLRREDIEHARRAARTARVHAHNRVSRRDPALRINGFPHHVLAAGTVENLRVLGEKPLPARREVSIAPRKPFPVGAHGEDHRHALVQFGTEYVSTQDESVGHRHGDVSLDVHAYEITNCWGPCCCVATGVVRV